MTKHYDNMPKPRLRAQFFFGLTLRDIATMAGLFVAFLGCIAVWVMGCWILFSMIRGVMEQ